MTVDLGSVVGALEVIDIPLDPAVLDGAVGVAEGIDLSDLEASAATVAEALASAAGEIPEVGTVLTAITDIVDLADQFASADLETEISALFDRLATELDNREGGALGAFIRLAESLNGAPQATLLKDLYAEWEKAMGNRQTRFGNDLSNTSIE